MNKEQTSRKHMVEATLGFLNENVAKWQSIAKIGEVKNKLTEVYAGIENTAMTGGWCGFSVA